MNNRESSSNNLSFTFKEHLYILRIVNSLITDYFFFLFLFQDPEKEVADWLSDLTLVDQHLDIEVNTL